MFAVEEFDDIQINMMTSLMELALLQGLCQQVILFVRYVSMGYIVFNML